MSNAIESSVEAVFVEALTAVATAKSLQLGQQISDQATASQRLVVAAHDMGEDKAVKVSGVYARSVEVDVRLRANVGDVTGDWMEATAAAVATALNPPVATSATLSPFALLVIHEVAASDLTFDKTNWAKQFTILVTAKLI